MKTVYRNLAILACLTGLMVESVSGQNAFTTPVFSSPRYLFRPSNPPQEPKELIPTPALPAAIPATAASAAAPIENAMRQPLDAGAAHPISDSAPPAPIPATAIPATPIPATDSQVPEPIPATDTTLPGPPTLATPASATSTAHSAVAGSGATGASPAANVPTPAATTVPNTTVPNTTVPHASVPTTAPATIHSAHATPASLGNIHVAGASGIAAAAHTPAAQPILGTLNPGPPAGRPTVEPSVATGVQPAFFDGFMPGEPVPSPMGIAAQQIGNSPGEVDAIVHGCDTCIDSPCGVWPHTTTFSASVNYLRFRNADVSYGVPIDGPISALLTSPIQVGAVGVVDPDYESGFDVTANLALSPLTSIGLNYLSIDSSTSDRIGTEAPNVIRSLVAHPSSTSAAADFLNANADLVLQMDIFDVTLRHLFVGGEVFAVNYFGGARYARLEQQFDSVFVNNGVEQVNTDIDFDGAGLTLGLEAERHSCTSRFHIYGRGAASFLAGRFNASYHQGQTFDPTVVATSWEAGRVVPILDLELGAGWKSKGGHIKLSAGYMVSTWFNTVKTEEFIEAVQLNDFNDLYQTLTLDGVVGRLEIGF